MKTINKIILIGNICTDPVLQSGRLLFRLATNREERQGKDRDIHQIVARSVGHDAIPVTTGDRVYIE
jgi:single-stranded DNA-binding protein